MKAMLIMDMPKCCADCILGDDDPSGLYCVAKGEYYDGQDTMESRASFCPLRECPKKQDVQMEASASAFYFGIGYNACIDEIGGGE